jgi:hypothetical protein
MISKHISWGEGLTENNQYNAFGRWGFDVYPGLVNCRKMVELADDIDKDAYTGLYLFIKAMRLFELTLAVGDIPYSDALAALDGVTTPKYDTQKDVCRQILDDLDAAYEHFDRANRDFDGDISDYNGSVAGWQRAVTTLQLKVLLNLCNKESDPDLNVKARFAKIVAERNMMQTNYDNLQLSYGTTASNQYPMYVIGGNRNSMYPDMTTTVMNPLKKYKDYRLFAFAEPSAAQVKAGVDAGDFDAYECVDPSDKYTEVIIAQRNAGHVSLLNNRFFEVQTGQPTIKLGFSELQFILAEAVLRGWITGNANEYYKEGIRSNLQFVMEYTPEKYAHGRKIEGNWIESFLSQSSLQLNNSAGASAENLEKIITQKYIAAFMNDTYTSYFEYRRTGFPELPINPETNKNTIPDRMPMRWMYEQREYDYNRDSVVEAVQRQFNGNDDVNELIWILK